MLVCLKMLVIFLICGDEYVKVAHLVPLLEGVGDLGKELFRCILSLNRVSRVRGKYSFTLCLTSALDGVGGQRHIPAALQP